MRFVYFISDGEYVKIGQTVTPGARLSSLQTGNAKKLYMIYCFDDSMMDDNGEALLHAKFRHLRVRGEWFRHTDEIDGFIEGFRASVPDGRIHYVGDAPAKKSEVVSVAENLVNLIRMMDAK